MLLTDKDRNPVNLDGIDEKTATAIRALHGGITAQMAAATNATLKPLQASIEAMTAQIETISKPDDSNTQPKPGDNTPAPKTEGGDDPVNQKILEELTKMNKRLDDVEAGDKEQHEKKQSLSLTQGYIEKNHPNLKGKEAVIARIASSKPKDDEAIKAAIEAEETYMNQTFGEELTTKLFSADLVSEGGESGEPDEAAAQIKSKKEALAAEVKAM